MPSGYTAYVKDGASFKDFALLCSRNFGAVLHMKDDSLSPKVEYAKVSSYYKDEIKKFKKELKILSNYTKAEMTVEYEKDNLNEIILYNERIKSMNKQMNSYKSMLVKAKEWNPPSEDHENLKEFMISQLEETINFDFYEIIKPVKKGKYVWIYDKIKNLNENIKYYEEMYLKEKARVKRNNAWIKELKDSLK